METIKKRKRAPKFINLDLWYEISVHDLKTGKRTRHRKGRCYSFTKYFLYYLHLSMSGAGRNLDFTNTAGNSRTGDNGLISSRSSSFRGALNASSTDSAWGAQVGTGTTAPTISDNKLATPIVHGTSAGNLQYGAVSFGAPSTSSDDTTFVVTRVFTNGSGGSITVKEIGLISQEALTVNGTEYILIARDVISDTAVPNGQALTLNYTFKTTA